MRFVQDNMNDKAMMTISAVERDTGLGKDTLRVWERRYAFPQPIRDAKGERLYTPEQVERLRLIKRLMDQGHRPGKLFAVGEEELLQLAGAQAQAAVSISPESGEGQAVARDTPIAGQIIDLLRAHEVTSLRQALNQTMMRQGLQRFVLDTVTVLNQSVGDAWMRGELQVFEEHLYSEQMSALLRQAIASLPIRADSRPRILLTTAPEERHVLGLLMAEVLFALEGATCISLGTQTPLFDIRQAAEAHRADVVALSFSSAFPTRLTTPLLKQLRELLPPAVELWAGGAGTEKLSAIEGVLLLPTLAHALAALQANKDGHLQA